MKKLKDALSLSCHLKENALMLVTTVDIIRLEKVTVFAVLMLLTKVNFRTEAQPFPAHLPFVAIVNDDISLLSLISCLSYCRTVL